MTIPPETLWVILGVIIALALATQVCIMVGYYHAVTQIKEVCQSAHLELRWALAFGWSLVPGVLGIVACIAQASTYQ